MSLCVCVCVCVCVCHEGGKLTRRVPQVDVGKLKLEMRCSEVREVVKDVVNLFSREASNHHNIIKYCP